MLPNLASNFLLHIHNRSVLQFVNKERAESVVFIYKLAEYPTNAIPETRRSEKIQLRGLLADASYKIEGVEGFFNGNFLMIIGFDFPLTGAFKKNI